MTFCILVFKDKPPTPPNAAQAKERSKTEDYTMTDLWNSYISILTNKPFLLQLLCYGINIGVFAAICTVLNQFVLSYFPVSVQVSFKQKRKQKFLKILTVFLLTVFISTALFVIQNLFQNSAEDAGMIGLLMIVLGMIGSVFFGYILDKTRKYK